MTEQTEKQLRKILDRSQKHADRKKNKAQRARKRSNSPHTPSAPELVGGLKLREAARYIGNVHPCTLRRAVERGLLTPNRVFRHLIFPIKELDRFLREGQV